MNELLELIAELERPETALLTATDEEAIYQLLREYLDDQC